MIPHKVVVDIGKGIARRIHQGVQLCVGVDGVVVVEDVFEGRGVVFEVTRTGGGVVGPGVVEGRGNEPVVIVQTREVPQPIQGRMEDPEGDVVGGAGLEHVPDVPGIAQHLQDAIVNRLRLFHTEQ